MEDNENLLRTADLREAVDLSEAELDKDSRFVRGVTIIASGWSKNDRYYPAATLQTAVGLFEGTKAYADHPPKGQSGRSIFELAGWYENVHMDDTGRMRADLFVEDDRVWTKVQTAVEKKPDYLGISINALGKTSLGEVDGRKGPIVEAITHANSGDIVTTPAAGGGFEQLMMSDDGWLSAVLENIDLREFREARPDLVDALKGELIDVRQTSAIRDLRDEVQRLEASLQASQVQAAQGLESNRALTSELHEARVDGLLSTSKLPAKWKVSLKESLLKAEAAGWPAILQREEEKAQSVPKRRPVRVTGAGGSAPTSTAQQMREAEQTNPDPNPGEDYRQWQKRIKQRRK